MRAAVGCCVGLAAMATIAFAAPVTTARANGSEPVPAGTPASAAAPLPSYHLHGYYKLLDQVPTWQQSDDSPWQVVKGEPWIKPRLVKWGYVPMTHDSQNYYCLIDDGPRTGSHVTEPIFICGDPKTVEWIFNTNRTPTVPLYGGP